MRSIALLITAVAVLVSVDPLAITAQQGPGSAPSRGPGWLARRSYLNDVGIRFTPAELTTVLSRLTEIDRTFLQVDELANPVGFEIEPRFGGGALTESVVGYRYDLVFFLPTKKIAVEGTACVSVTVNSPPGRGINAMNGYRDDRGEFVFEDQRGDPIPGATHVWNRLSATERSWVDVMFTSGRVSPLEPVTRERFQRAKVRFFEAFQSGLASDTPYERWMAEAPQRKADREGLRATLPPAQAATLVKTLEDAERETTASLKAADAADRAETTQQVTAFRQAADYARTQLAQMPAAERPLPAWIERRAELPPGVSLPPGDLAPLVTPDTPLAARVFVTQLDLYKGQRSRVNPRVIQVHLSASLTCDSPTVQRAVFQMYKKLDWAALARLVDPPVVGARGIRAVVAGGSHVAAITNSGGVMTWGSDAHYETGRSGNPLVPALVKGLDDVRSLAAADGTNTAVRGSGWIMTWGEVRGWTRPGSGGAGLSPFPILLWLDGLDQS